MCQDFYTDTGKFYILSRGVIIKSCGLPKKAYKWKKRFESVKMIFDKHTHRRKPLMAILQLIAEKEKSLCFDFLEKKEQ